MPGEKDTKSLLRVALERGLFPARIGRSLGGYALTKAAEVYDGRPAEGEPHISERIQSEIAVNEALVGKQFVDIAALTDPASAETVAEERELKDKRRGYRLYGHFKIVKALLKAETDPQVSYGVEQQVVDIAIESGTNPARLDSMLSEHERERAQRIIEP